MGTYRTPLGGGPAELIAPLSGFDVAVGPTHVFISGSPYVLQFAK